MKRDRAMRVVPVEYANFDMPKKKSAIKTANSSERITGLKVDFEMINHGR
jgi:hypothetical protein